MRRPSQLPFLCTGNSWRSRVAERRGVLVARHHGLRQRVAACLEELRDGRLISQETSQ